MNNHYSSLVFTKLSVPILRERLISRNRLLDSLNAADTSRLVLVCAPAGYGKTTLLITWAHSLIKRGIKVIWYALDSDDDDPIPFKSYFVASLLQTFGLLPELVQLSELLRSKPEIELKYVLTNAINAIQSCDQKCVLILDDYHVISSPVIHDALFFLVEHLPENLQVVLGSRADPPIPLARLRARRQLVELRINHLRFSAQECTRFLNELMQLDLSFQDIQVLEQRTEGWIAGLQLAALSLSGCDDKDKLVASFSGSNRYLVEYLMEEVVYRQPEEVQVLMEASSILERFCPPLCEHLLLSGQLSDKNVSNLLGAFNNIQVILESLEKANMFLVPIDEERTWFRYHHLFRDFLLTRLKKHQPEIIPLLHKSACAWLVSQSLIREASSHAFQVNDWEYTASFVEEQSFNLITHSDLSTIYEWCSKIPEEVMQKHPILCLQQALSMAFSLGRNNQSKIKARLQQVNQVMETNKDLKLERVLWDLSGVVQTFMAFAPDLNANPHETLELSEIIIANNPEEDAGQFSGLLLRGYAQMALQDTTAAEQTLQKAKKIALHAHLYFGIVESAFQLAQLFHNQGHLQQAAEICIQSKQEISSLLPKAEKDLPALGSLDVVLGCIQLEQNDLTGAEHYLRRGLELMGGGMSPNYQMTAFLALSRLCEITGQQVEAAKYLDELDAVWPDISFYTAGLRVLNLLGKAPNSPSALNNVRTWCEESSTLFTSNNIIYGIGPYGAAELYYLAQLLWFQAQIATGNAAIVRPHIQYRLDQAKAHGLIQRVIELSLLNALIFDSQGDQTNVRVSMEQAIGLAQQEGYLRIFDQVPSLNHLLVNLALQSKYKEYIKKIMTMIPSPTLGEQERVKKAFFGQTLSERELEVLQMIARGATNQEIAETLVVTVGTVKSHINHILRKLDSHNRTEALAKARQLGFPEI